MEMLMDSWLCDGVFSLYLACDSTIQSLEIMRYLIDVSNASQRPSRDH